MEEIRKGGDRAAGLTRQLLASGRRSTTQPRLVDVNRAIHELEPMLRRYDPKQLCDGWNTMPDGERIFYVSNPALGLWAYRGRLT